MVGVGGMSGDDTCREGEGFQKCELYTFFTCKKSDLPYKYKIARHSKIYKIFPLKIIENFEEFSFFAQQS